jgi:Tol biopolymer transport system component
MSIDPGTASSTAVASQPPTPLVQKRFGNLPWLWFGLIVVLLILAAGGTWWFLQKPLAGPEIVIASPNRSGEADIYLLSVGQKQRDGKLLAENAVSASSIEVWKVAADESPLQIGGAYGGFIPNSNRLLLWYKDDETGKYVMRRMKTTDSSPIDVIKSKIAFVGVLFAKSENMFVLESGGTDTAICDIAKPDGEAERLAKGDLCIVSLDGSTIFFSETNDQKTTITALGADGGSEQVLIKDEKGILSFKPSSDGSLLAYLQSDLGDLYLRTVDRQGGLPVEVAADAARIANYEFLPNSRTLAYTLSKRAGDDYELFLSDSETPIVSAPTLNYEFSIDGKYLAYWVPDTGDKGSLFVRTIGSGTDQKVLDGENVTFRYAPAAVPGWVVIDHSEKDTYDLYSVSPDGKTVTALFEKQDNTFAIHFLQNKKPLFFVMTDAKGNASLSVATLDGTASIPLLEEWYAFQLLNLSPDGSQLVFSAQQNKYDDPVLYVIALAKGAKPVRLDNDNLGFSNAVFMPDGKTILYTAISGKAINDLEIRQVSLDGKSNTLLYSRSLLMDIAWDVLNPVHPLMGS